MDQFLFMTHCCGLRQASAHFLQASICGNFHSLAHLSHITKQLQEDIYIIGFPLLAVRLKRHKSAPT
jgi:hypothetical protein